MTFKKWMVGAVLTGVMVAALGTNAILFSARDFQHGLAQIAPSTNGLIDFNHLREADAQIQQIEAESAAQRGELIQIEQGLAAIDGEIAGEVQAVNEARAQLAGQIAAVEVKAGAPAAETAQLALDGAALDARIQSLAAAPLPPAEQQTLASLQGQVRQLAEAEQGLDARDAARLDLTARQRLVGGQVAESDRRIFALKQSVIDNYEQYDRVRGEVMALTNMSPLGVGATLAQGHPSFVSTILVLLMGALGAILYLFPAYMSRAAEVTFAEIIIRLIFGMCTALAFYIIANTTLAGFSFVPGQTAASGASTLNPFTVSLIGIVAGVMADDIAKWIKNRGTEILGGDPGQPAAPPPPAAAAEPDFTGVNPHGGPGAP